jgi:hypothetical protein
VTLAWAITTLLQDRVSTAGFIFFYTAVVLSAWYGGRWGGLLAVILGTLQTLRYKLFTLPGELIRPGNRPVLRFNSTPARTSRALHRQTPQKARPAQLNESPVFTPDPGMTNQQSTVFVVDDDPAICEAVTRLIASVGLYVETFGSTRDFLAAKRSDGPACLVLDVRLPDVSGLEFRRELAQSGFLYRSSSSPAMATYR